MKSRQQSGTHHRGGCQGDRKDRPYISIILLLAMGVGMAFAVAQPGMSFSLAHTVVAASSQQARTVVAGTTAQHAGNTSTATQALPTPFMHRPFYGNQTIGQRTTSFVDHDKPWYVNDGIFVRYNGTKWTNVAIGSCIGGVNCYDGHNGYDLNLWYEPVLSVAAGTVIRAGWYNPLNHQSSLGLWVAVDHGNGYVTAYGHLSALTVATGDQVGTQWQVGTSGTTGSSTGPHLHMATYYLPYWNATDPFGWTGNYPDPNAVPDYYLWVDNPGTSGTVPNLSANGNAVYPGATLVDDGSTGWSSTGNWNTDTASSDIRGNLHWTSTTNGAATATATWQPTLPADGYYEVGVFVNDNHASSSWAPYTVYSTDPNHPGTQISHSVYVDETHIGAFQGPFSWENLGPQWISLGTYYFKASQPGRVVLSNATGENGLQVSADGVEFAPVSVQTTTPPPPPTPVYRFAVTSDSTPNTMLPNSTTTVNLTLKNTSNFSWNATGSGTVQAIYRWLNDQNSVVATSSPIALPQKVDPNSSVTVAVSVQAPAKIGAYTLQWDVIQGTKVFSQQGAQVQNDTVQVIRFAEVFAPSSLPTTLTPGATVNVNVSVQNKGPVAWPAHGNAQVTLSYTWLDSSGKPLASSIAGPGATGTLPADVAPGGSTTVPITLHTPVLAGNYQLVYDLQQQGTWFSSQGATPLKLTVTITPTLPRVYYFAEGYTGTGTTEYLSLTNLSANQANVSVTYLFSNAAAQTRTYQVPAQAHSVLNINAEVGGNLAVSMIVQGDQPFVAERTMLTHNDTFVAASDSVGSTTLSTTWYFAEGNTTSGWNTLLAVMNPSQQPVTMRITYLLNARAISPLQNGSTYTIPAHSRTTIVLNRDMPNQQFGMVIRASAAVMIERPEYLVISPLRGGNAVVGATAPQTTWYFGAGNTSTGFNERLVLANPSPGWATVQIRYLTANGQVIPQTVGVPGQSRIEVNVNTVVKQVLHATMITASSPIIAERQDFFMTNFSGAVPGSTTSMGATNPHTSWYVAQGDTTSGHAESLNLANPNPGAAQVQVVYYMASGAPIIKTYTLAANSRITISLASDVGTNQTVGTALYSSAPIVVEQTMLFNMQQGISGGYAAMALGM